MSVNHTYPANGNQVEVLQKLESMTSDRYVKLGQRNRVALVSLADLSSPAAIRILKSKGIVFPSTKEFNDLKERIFRSDDFIPGHIFLRPGWYPPVDSDVFVFRDGTVFGELDGEPRVALFDTAPHTEPTGSLDAWKKTCKPLLKKHPVLLYLLGSVMAAPLLSGFEHAPSTLVIEIRSKSPEAQDLAVRMAESVFGTANTTRLNGRDVHVRHNLCQPQVAGSRYSRGNRHLHKWREGLQRIAVVPRSER